MVMSAADIKDILDRVDQYAQMAREAMKTEGKPLGAETMTDEEHARLFEMKAAENPNWILALPYVEGGLQELTRYERTRGLRGG